MINMAAAHCAAAFLLRLISNQVGCHAECGSAVPGQREPVEIPQERNGTAFLKPGACCPFSLSDFDGNAGCLYNARERKCSFA